MLLIRRILWHQRFKVGARLARGQAHAVLLLLLGWRLLKWLFHAHIIIAILRKSCAGGGRCLLLRWGFSGRALTLVRAFGRVFRRIGAEFELYFRQAGLITGRVRRGLLSFVGFWIVGRDGQRCFLFDSALFLEILFVLGFCLKTDFSINAVFG